MSPEQSVEHDDVHIAGTSARSATSEDERRRRRSTAAKIGANARWAFHDPFEGTKAARAGFDDKFLKAVDPDGVLSPDERVKRAQRLKRAHMLALAQKSARVRAQRKNGRPV